MSMDMDHLEPYRKVVDNQIVTHIWRFTNYDELQQAIGECVVMRAKAKEVVGMNFLRHASPPDASDPRCQAGYLMLQEIEQ